MAAPNKYAYEHKGVARDPRPIERELPDKALLEEIELAVGNPERSEWLAKLRAEAKRRGL